jgi:hypothetical protein
MRRDIEDIADAQQQSVPQSLTLYYALNGEVQLSKQRIRIAKRTLNVVRMAWTRRCTNKIWCDDCVCCNTIAVPVPRLAQRASYCTFTV